MIHIVGYKGVIRSRYGGGRAKGRWPQGGRKKTALASTTFTFSSAISSLAQNTVVYSIVSPIARTVLAKGVLG